MVGYWPGLRRMATLQDQRLGAAAPARTNGTVTLDGTINPVTGAPNGSPFSFRVDYDGYGGDPADVIRLGSLRSRPDDRSFTRLTWHGGASIAR